MPVNAPNKMSGRRDIGIPLPNPRIGGPSEQPRLDTNVAPYLPLQQENERHEYHFVILNGKVVAFDNLGFVVPAGLGLQQVALLPHLGLAAQDVSALGLELYDATDVAQGVVNSLGVAALAGEPVIWSMIDGAPAWDAAFDLSNLDLSAAGTTNDLASYRILISGHIGFAQQNWYRNPFDHADILAAATAASNKFDDNPRSTITREYNFEFGQDRVSVSVAHDTFLLPVVTDRTGLLIEGQAAAIGTGMSDFRLGSYVTYDLNSDVVPMLGADLSSAFHYDGVAAVPALPSDMDEWAQALSGVSSRIVGQVIQQVVRGIEADSGSAYLEYVKTRWEESTPGTEGLDRMPGSATDGKTWNQHVSGTVVGEIKISPLMR